MGRIYRNFGQLVGRTPLLLLENYSKLCGVSATLAAKLEYFSPSGSVKDRIALQMIKDAEADGRLREGSIIIEPSSGNTAIALAAYAASKRYHTIFVMPENTSSQRRKLLRAYGAEIYLTDATLGTKGAVDKAYELSKNLSGSFVPEQFDNLSNSKAHYLTTGPEIWEDIDGEVDAFVCGVGTGGTITGVGEYLKSRNLGIKIYAVEPSESPVLSGGSNGLHKIQGIGAGFVPEVLNTLIYDEVITVTNRDATDTARLLAKSEGILTGISSGAALWAATQVAKRSENRTRTIVVLLPDAGERYLSSELFDD